MGANSGLVRRLVGNFGVKFLGVDFPTGYKVFYD